MKLTVFTYVCLALFCTLLIVGIAIGNAWIALSCVIPLIIGMVKVIKKRYFDH